MNRRDLLASATLVPAGALAATAQQQQEQPAPPPPPKGPAKAVKITVIKRAVNSEFQRYRDEGKEIPICTAFKDGQEIMVDFPWPLSTPKGFCTWAWDDILKTAWAVYAGKGPDRAMACCSDGYRPVYFLIERVV